MKFLAKYSNYKHHESCLETSQPPALKGSLVNFQIIFGLNMQRALFHSGRENRPEDHYNNHTRLGM